jgi:hypothetical protein
VNSGVLVLRRRNGWEACDSGVLLFRRNYRPLLLFTGIPILALAAAIRFFSGAPLFVSWLALWWLKPLWDRLALHIVSVRFFEPESSLRRLFSGLWRTVFRGLCGDLLWRRFSPWRAARLPVRVLETPAEKTEGKISRRNYRQRISSLSGGGLGFCVFLTFFGSVLEEAVITGEAFFGVIMWQMFGLPFQFGLLELVQLFEPVLLALYGMNLALLEGLYVCMGFGLYIRSRVEVEGWDIQLLLQKAASSASASAAKSFAPKALLVFAFFSVFSIFSIGRAFPEDGFPAAGTAAVPLDALDGVLASPDFGGTRETWGIRLKQEPEPKEEAEKSASSSEPAAWYKRFRELSSLALRFVLVAGIVFFVIFSCYRLFRMKKNRAAGTSGKFYGNAAPSPDKPRELLERARLHYRQGNTREAWALCFRAARAACGISKNLVFPPGATEYNCLALVRESVSDKAEGFARLVQHWVHFAYAGKLPPHGAFEEALGFGYSLIGENGEGETRA